ncbi:tyrosine-type recombinase/integrase [Flavobacterium microcysteis]|uniref:Integrase n=1 Tax=Flavobacterium microcysteis TaxID=2596891 RepID=A0A501QBX8_9FLAO|nr:tyrosine-type recombinase/integrase [Flavobacterium microcysteis]TPD69908.1 integrase [Flavobacterium microcysteis]
MDNKFQFFQKIVIQAEEYLFVNLNFSPTHIEYCKKDWRTIRYYLESLGYTDFSIAHEMEIRNYFINHTGKKRKTRSSERMNTAITALCEYAKTSKISLRTRTNKTKKLFTGELGIIIEKFIRHEREIKRLSYIRSLSYERELDKFYKFCSENLIKSIHEIDLAFLLSFINQIPTTYKSSIQTAISALRGFIQYLFSNQLIATNFSNGIPRYKTISQKHLSSTYTKEEVERIIESIDRSTPRGKRNYAIILLLARLGLRVSDVSNLKFENLDWNSNLISITQFKTGKNIVLPLLPEIGNAIIDYLKYGRAESDEKRIFLSCVSPYNSITTASAISSRIASVFKHSGVHIDGRKTGPHSLRHSLGYRLLQENTALPVISQILGHQNTQSTKYYLRIDLTSLRHCILDVPLIDKEFYEQRKYSFYG